MSSTAPAPLEQVAGVRRAPRPASVRRQLTVLYLTCWIPLCLLLALGLWYEFTRDKEEAEAALSRSASSAALRLKLMSEEYLQVARILAGRPRLMQVEPACEASLADTVRIRAVLADLVVLDPDGAYLCTGHAGSSLAGQSSPYAALASRAKQKDAFQAGPPHRFAEDGTWVLPVAFPLFDGDRPRGFLVFLFRAELWRTTVADHLPKGAVANLVASDGTLLARYPRTDGALGSLNVLPSLKGAATEVPRVAEGLDGVRRLYAVATVPSLGVVQVGLATSVIEGPAQRKALALGIAALALLTISALLCRRIAASFATSIEEIASVTGALRKREASRQILRTAASAELHAIANDINHLGRAMPELAAALVDTEERYRSLVEWSPHPILIHSSRGTSYANRALASLLRVPTFGSHDDLADFVQPEDREQFAARIERLRTDCGTAAPMLFRLRAADGTPIFAMHSCSSVRQQGGIAVQSHLIDVTAQQAVEAQLRELTQHLELQVAARTEQLRRANESLESFAYSVAHDLRSPVSNAGAFAGAAQEALAAGHCDKAKHYASRVEANTRLANEMIEGLLRFSRAASDQLSIGDIHMDRLVRDVAEQLGAPDGVVTVDGSLGCAKADRQLIRHVWMNLVSNALKFSAASPDPRVVVSRREEGDEVVFTVADNGIGFSPEQQDKLFRVFSRLVDQDEFSGTGIGLATVKRVVERHGGSVWAAGEPGEGARFCFSLPLAPQALNRTA